MNWGKGLVIGMLLFMGFIVSMSCYMFNMPADDYEHQYYEKGLNFNHDYDREKQVITDKAQPAVTQLDNSVSIIFKQPAVGTVTFLNPLGKSKDLTFPVNTGESSSVTIPAGKLTSGRWAVKVNWKSNGKEYLYQQDIFIDGQ